MILLNGALIWNPITETVIDSSPFLEYQKLELLKIEQDYGISGFYISEKENTCQFHLHRETPEWMHYFESHSFPIPDFSPLESAPLLLRILLRLQRRYTNRNLQSFKKRFELLSSIFIKTSIYQICGF